MNLMETLPIGKLPAALLAKLLSQASLQDKRVLIGPGIGLDCAVVEAGDSLFVLKSDPITFASDAIGWYAVQINANDIATTGAIPCWFLATLLLPEKTTTANLVERIFGQIQSACHDIGITLVGGHTEITHGLARPILVGTLIGETKRDKLVTPRGAQPGDRLLLTKGAPIEATAVLAREFPERLISKPNQPARSGLDNVAVPNGEWLTDSELAEAQNYLYKPGISIMREAQLACRTGEVHAMHDPTEGGIYTALWEMSEACGYGLSVDLKTVPVPSLAGRICFLLGLDPLAAIASGALLLAVPKTAANKIRITLEANDILCVEIGQVLDKPGPLVIEARATPDQRLVPRPARDAIAELFDTNKEGD